MKRVSSKSTITLQEVEDHYQSSRENYDIESAESHLALQRKASRILRSVITKCLI